MKNNGKKIVLTAPDTDFTDFYNNPILPFFFFSISRYSYGGLLNLFMKGGKQEVYSDGTAKLAPYGLRKIEASLLESGFDEDDIVIIHPRSLKKFIGKNTKAIGISAMNTNGLTYCDQTFTALIGFGTDSYNSYKFRDLMFNRAIRKSNAKIILGGAGAWQVKGDYSRSYFGIDSVVMGEGELVSPSLFKDAVEGKTLPAIVEGKPIDENEIPCIRNGAIYGTVEISRGCGRNCQFCTPTKRKRRDIPLSRIRDEIMVNMETRKYDPDKSRGGKVITPTSVQDPDEMDKKQEKFIFVATEDLLIYGCRDPKFMPNTEAILDLIQVFVDCGVDTFQPAHISLAASAASPNTVERVSEALSYFDDQGEKQIRGIMNFMGKKRYIGVETGLETGSSRIIEKYMRGKCLPFEPKDWHDVVIDAMGVLNDNYWFPYASLMIGMPDETDDDALKTLELLDDLKFAKVFYAPMFFTSLGDTILRNKRSANMKILSDLQKEIFLKCWGHTIKVFEPQLRSGIQKHLLKFVGGFWYNTYYRWREEKDFFKRLVFNVTGLPLSA